MSELERLLEEWKAHRKRVEHSSRLLDYINCDAYHTLVALGPQSLPEITDTFTARPDLVPDIELAMLLRDLGVQLEIPERMRGRVAEIQELCIAYLQKTYGRAQQH